MVEFVGVLAFTLGDGMFKWDTTVKDATVEVMKFKGGAGVIVLIYSNNLSGLELSP